LPVGWKGNGIFLLKKTYLLDSERGYEVNIKQKFDLVNDKIISLFSASQFIVRSNFEISNMKTNKYLKRTKILRMKRV
jgi:hypothetical protein